MFNIIIKILKKCIKPYYHINLEHTSKPSCNFRHLKKGVKEFHWTFLLAPEDKVANKVVVV